MHMISLTVEHMTYLTLNVFSRRSVGTVEQREEDSFFTRLYNRFIDYDYFILSLLLKVFI